MESPAPAAPPRPSPAVMGGVQPNTCPTCYCAFASSRDLLKHLESKSCAMSQDISSGLSFIRSSLLDTEIDEEVGSSFLVTDVLAQSRILGLLAKHVGLCIGVGVFIHAMCYILQVKVLFFLLMMFSIVIATAGVVFPARLNDFCDIFLETDESGYSPLTDILQIVFWAVNTSFSFLNDALFLADVKKSLALAVVCTVAMSLA